MTWFRGVVVLCALVGPASRGQLPQRDQRAIRDALLAASLTEEDLGFARFSVRPPLTPNCVPDAVARPLEGVDFFNKLHSEVDGSVPQQLKRISEQIYGDSPVGSAMLTGAEIPATVNLPESIRGPIGALAQAVSDANAAIRRATEKLTAEEKRVVIEGLPQWASQGTSLKFGFVKNPRPGYAQVLSYLSRVDLAAIRTASVKLALRIDEILPDLRAAAKSGWAGSEAFMAAGITIEVKGVGDDAFVRGNSNLCVDLGGRNRYSGRYGAGIGYAGVMIDLGTETVVDMMDASAGCGILGIGYAYFGGVKPDLRGANLCFGAGVAGVGVAKIEKAFYMEARAFGQGAGIAGVGLLVASDQTDNAKHGYFGQGAGMLGGTGWYIDKAGNDRYRSGGVVADGESPGFFLSRVQGYSGILPGGIGLITDMSGDDLYDAGSDAQACSMRFGVGSLGDYDGNDTYLAHRNAQSSADNNGFAFLLEASGDDLYTARLGAVHAYASNRSVAMLIDREGNDLYAARQSQPGSAQEGSVAIAIDADGSDLFAGSPGAGLTVNGRQGFGLFVKSGRDSTFLNGPTQNTIRLNGTTGVAASSESNTTTTLPQTIAPGSLRLEVDEIDSLWERVSANGSASVQASRQLVGVGLPAFQRFVEVHAGFSTVAARRTAAAIVKSSPNAAKFMSDKASSANAATLGALFDVAGYAKDPDLKPFIAKGLESDLSSRQAVRYAGVIKAKEFLQPISALILSGDAITAQEAVIALSEIGDSSTVSTMEAILTTKDQLSWLTAVKFIARFPERAEPMAKSYLQKPDVRSQLTGLELLSGLGSPDTIRLVGAGMNSPHPQVKIRSMALLNHRVPEGYRQRVLELMEDPNPVVAAVARGLDLGK